VEVGSGFVGVDKGDGVWFFWWVFISLPVLWF